MNVRTINVRRVLRILGMALAMLIVLILFTGRYWGSSHYVVRSHVIYYEELPTLFDGYRILHFSDLHVGTFRGGDEDEIQDIVNLINEQKCDMVVFTGDLVNRESSEVAGLRDVFSQIKAQDGVYSVLGNHDYGTYNKDWNETQQKADKDRLLLFQEGYKWTPLLNDHVVVHRGKQSIVLAGVECYGNPPFPQFGDLPKALKGVKRSDFVILLSHDPSFWRNKVVGTSVQLTLSGHTHAGQFKIWGWSPVSWKCDEWSGIYKEGNQVLNVSEGLGGLIGPFRYGAWPEVSVITLRKLQVKK